MSTSLSMQELRTMVKLNNTDGVECWYRYEDVPTSSTFSMGPSVDVNLRKFPVLKHTPCGAWVDLFGEKRFVRKDAHKKFACQTREEALESFIMRKKRQVGILSAQLERAQDALKIAKSFKGENNEEV